MDTAASSLMTSDHPNNPARQGRKWPASNALRFYREQKDVTLQEVAKALNTNHQTIQKLEAGTMRLTPEWAERIGSILHVPGRFLAFSNGPDTYSWAVKAVDVDGLINDEMRVTPIESPRRIGVPEAPIGMRALELGKNSLPGFERWTVLYDKNATEPMTLDVLERQAQSTQFLIRTRDGDMWYRRIVPGARRRSYHLESLHKQTIYDVEIEWVCEVLGLELPGQDLPLIDQQRD